jgi:hypothetical protein
MMAAINNANVVYDQEYFQQLLLTLSHVHEYNNGSPQTINLTSDTALSCGPIQT